jgi:hypothetical protein
MAVILDHEHGVNQQNCGHPACREAVSRYRKQWAVDRLAGKARVVDAEPVKRHIWTLMYDYQWSQRAIAGEAGVAVQVVNKVLHGQKRMLVAKAQAILAVDPEKVPAKPSKQTTEPFVWKRGAVRRLRALMAIGWPGSVLHERLGFSASNVIHQQGRWITRSKHDAIAALYRELSMRPGPSGHARTCAAKAGYPGPLAWGDIDNDDEPDLDEGEPVDDDYLDEAAILRRMAGEQVKLTDPEKVELIRRWVADGRTLGECGRTTGLKVDRYFRFKDQEGAA